MVIDFANDNGTNQWPGIGAAESARLLRRVVGLASADDVAAEGPTQRCSPEVKSLGVSGEVHAIAREKPDVVAFGAQVEGVHPHAKRISRVEDQITAGGDNSARLDKVFFGKIKIIGQKPTA